MFYVVSFDGCGIESPLQARSAVSALALAEEAERNGCENVRVQVPDGGVLSIRQFADQYGVAAKKTDSEYSRAAERRVDPIGPLLT